MRDFKYRAFISYSWKDRAAAERLHRALETYRAPKALGGARLVPIFRDRDEEAAGANLKVAIEDALDNSEFLIVVCSPNAAASPWVNKEIAYFRKNRTPANVLSYVIAGEPGADAFPPALLFESTVDGAVAEEPIEPPLAADAREEGDGERPARLKIVAAMLGVGLDDLVRRDAQRRTRNLRAALAGVSAVALGFAALGATAAFQWREAVKNAQRAEREALKASRTAEFMVALFEVPDPGESRGRDVTAKEILDKGVQSIEKELAGEPDVQATLMHTMGRTYTGLGLYSEAVRILAIARKKRAETNAPPHDRYATDNALARAFLERGNLNAAKEIYARLVAEAEADLKNGGWRIDYAAAMIGMGETTLYADTPEEAQRYYERARELLRRRNLQRSGEFGAATRGLANALLDQRKFEEAEPMFAAAVALATELYGARDYRVAGVENDLAGLYYSRRRPAQALEHYRKVREIESEVLGSAHPETLMTDNNVARMELELGRIDVAAGILDRVVTTSEQIGRDQDFDFVFPLNSYGEVKAEQSDFISAISFFGRALTIAQSNDNRMYGPIRLNLGRAECASGDVAAGLENVRIGRAALQSHYEDDDWRYGAADEFESRCRAAAGEKNRAADLARSAHDRFQDQLGDDHFFTRRARKWLDSLSA